VSEKIARLLRGKTASLPAQAVRYAAGGGAAFAVDATAMIALTELASCHYLLSAAVGYGCGVATHYATSVAWVFDRRAVPHRSLEFMGFAALGLVGLGINALALTLFTEVIALHYAVSKVFATIPSFTWNFTSRKSLLFTIRDVAAPPTALAHSDVPNKAT
jgi:putative flippase GtrA